MNKCIECKFRYNKQTVRISVTYMREMFPADNPSIQERSKYCLARKPFTKAQKRVLKLIDVKRGRQNLVLC